MAESMLNKKFQEHRLRLTSPSRRGRRMSRAELAVAVNRKLAQLYPGKRSLLVTARWIKDVELGNSSWPWKERRLALRIVLGAASDAEIGLFDPRMSDAVIDAGLASPHMSGHGGDRRVDWSRPQSDRVYDCLLGGKDHHAPDRAMAEDLLTAFPSAAIAAAANRAFLKRAVRFLAEAGIRQFLDIGAGVPRSDSTHAVAQSIAPDSRVVYVDNDPIVMTHVRALHISNPAGRVEHVEADLRDPDAVLTSMAVLDTLDLRRPVGVVLGAVLHDIADDEDAATAVKQLLDPMPPGSFLVISHASTDFSDSDDATRYEEMYAAGRVLARARPAATIRNYLHGLDLVEPGLVPICEWRPDADPPASPDQIGMYGVVGRVQ
ncbi:SAM-dependent methyltransferase [Actinoplanes sp. HUAS TT8]|uniref:SAM-dependent methyltransferase n=1 Tax=Actinoplanes sp. HUAS TT8 TaxID=3447453 RepID=UPI003F51E7F4